MFIIRVWITALLMLIFCKKSVSQTTSLHNISFYGTWEWISETNDTLTIILKPVGQYKNSLWAKNRKEGKMSEIVGFHRYVAKSKELESSLSFSSEDTISLNSTIGGIFKNQKSCLISIQNRSVKTGLTGDFILLPDIINGKLLALLDIGHKFVDSFYGDLPLRRTIPNRIVLEKIKNYEGVPD